MRPSFACSALFPGPGPNGAFVFPADFCRRVFVVNFLVRLATANTSNLGGTCFVRSRLLMVAEKSDAPRLVRPMPERPRLVQHPAESVPRRQKRETFERERMKPIRRFCDKQCKDRGQTFVRGQPQLARFSEEIHRDVWS